VATAASDDVSASPVPAGPAHVAVVSFLAARAAPTGGFWIALAGGVALARTAERRGARLGFGASAAAMLETVAIIGPARFGIPLTQAASAPMLGRLEARGAGFLPQFLACAAIRLLHNTATTAFFIWVIVGGLDAYAGTYDAIGRRLGLEVGTADALGLTVAGLLAWAAFASTVQVLVYRRGLRGWDDLAERHARNVDRQIDGQRSKRPGRQPRFDARAVVVAAALGFAALLSGTSWPLLATVALLLAIAWIAARPGRCLQAWRSPASWAPAPPSSPSAAASASTRPPGAPLEPPCSSWSPPGCAPRPARRGSGRCRAGCWAGFAASPRRRRRLRCSTRSRARARASSWSPAAASPTS
jgi:hypothetical protein